MKCKKIHGMNNILKILEFNPILILHKPQPDLLQQTTNTWISKFTKDTEY